MNLREKKRKWHIFDGATLCTRLISFVYGEKLTHKPLAVRIPEEIGREVQENVKREGLDKVTVVRTFLELGISEWRKQTALELLRGGKEFKEATAAE